MDMGCTGVAAPPRRPGGRCSHPRAHLLVRASQFSHLGRDLLAYGTPANERAAHAVRRLPNSGRTIQHQHSKFAHQSAVKYMHTRWREEASMYS